MNINAFNLTVASAILLMLITVTLALQDGIIEDRSIDQEDLEQDQGYQSAVAFRHLNMGENYGVIEATWDNDENPGYADLNEKGFLETSGNQCGADGPLLGTNPQDVNIDIIGPEGEGFFPLSNQICTISGAEDTLHTGFLFRYRFEDYEQAYTIEYSEIVGGQIG